MTVSTFPLGVRGCAGQGLGWEQRIPVLGAAHPCARREGSPRWDAIGSSVRGRAWSVHELERGDCAPCQVALLPINEALCSCSRILTCYEHLVSASDSISLPAVYLLVTLCDETPPVLLLLV